MRYAESLLSQAKEVAVDEQYIDESGILRAQIYVDQLSLGQELLYKYLVVEDSESTTWCDS